MSPSTRTLRFALALLVLGAPAARAAGRFAAPGAGALLQGGATVPVGWGLSGMAAREFGEMELVLSLDGGRTFPIRVTRDLDPQARSLLWRVPILPTRHARLALRAGNGEEPQAEALQLVSEEFAIETDAVLPLETTLAVRGEWRTREAAEGCGTEAPRDPRALAGQDRTLRGTPDFPNAAAPRPRSYLGASAPRRTAIFESVRESPSDPTRSGQPRTSRNAPRRE